MNLSDRLRRRDSENRRARERLIWRFRLGAVIFSTVQTLVEPGDDTTVAWIIVGCFWASVLSSRIILAQAKTNSAIRRLGVQSMAIDCAVVAGVLANNMRDPAEPVYLVTILAVLEATMRWPRFGGTIGGFVAGSAAAAWTIMVYHGLGLPLEISFATFQFGVLLVLGIFFGALTRRLSDQHRALERILDTSRDLIVTLEPGGTVLSVNAACESILGLPPERVIGRPAGEFLDPDQRPVDLADGALLSRLEPGAPPLLAMRRFSRPDGSRRWLELSLSSDPGTGIIYVTGRDATDRVEAERQVATSEQRFRSLFDHNADAVYSLDVEGRFTAANPATERLSGFRADELHDSTFEDLIAPEHSGRTLERFRQALAGESQNYDTVVIARDGRRLELDVTNMPIIVDGEVVGVFGVAKDVTGRRQLERQLSHQATHDSLTGLPNRLLLEEFLDMAMSGQPAVPTTLLFVDLDRFKIVNDSLGHRCGDELLVLVVKRLASCLRAEDVLVRWAGDEFCVLLARETSEAAALSIADRLLAVIAEPFVIDGRDVRLSASIGLAQGRADDTPERLVQRADMAMYDAKRSGRNRVSIHEPDREVHGSNPIDFEMELREAIASEHLVLEYQPIVELATGRIVAVEALVRWRLPDGSFRPPDEFIAAAEESGLIRSITRWVLGEATRQLSEWDRITGSTDDLRVWVNISGVDLQADDHVADIVDALSSAAIDPDRLVLEVTESTLLVDLDQVDRTVEALRDLGISLAIDDFGTGYSSMSQLHRLRVAACKIDRTFVANAPTSECDAAIIRSLTDLGSVFGFAVVGEGVETVEQLRVIEAAGCGLAQGYLLARPCPPADLVERLRLGHVDPACLVH